MPDNNRKFVMRRIPVVGSVDGPAVPGHVDPSASRIDHRLNADYHSVDKSASMPLAPVIGNAGFLVHILAQPVTFQFTDHGKSE